MKKMSCFLLVLFLGLILTGCHKHSYDEVVTEPTCTEAGYTTYTCECGESYVANEVAAKGHAYGDWVVVKEATENEEGLKEKTCSVCNDKVSEAIAKLAHTHNYTEKVVDATCTEKGYKEYTCSCGDTYKEEIEAKGHTEVEVAGKEATCTEAGLTAGKKCSVCDEVLVAQEEVAALGHTEVEVAAVEATCTEAGLTAGKKCSVCDEVLVAQEEVAALGHTEVEVAAVEATCTEAGLTAGKKCSVCDEVLVAQEEVAALGHTEVVSKEKVEATCTEKGSTEEKKCSVCNEVTVASEEIEALGHTEKVEVEAVEATCTEKGSTTKLVCEVCNEVLQEVEEIEALGHTEETVAGKDATCSEPGLTEGTKCSVCGEVLKAQEEITAAHTLVYYLAQEADCDTIGYNAHSECTVCGWTDYEEIPAWGHVYGDFVVDKEPTDLECGYESRHCIVCDDRIQITIIPALGVPEEPEGGETIEYSVSLDYNGMDYIYEFDCELEEAFLTDFYNWCIKQNVFTESDVTLSAFLGTGYNGLWANYVGGAGNPSSLFPNYSAVGNYFLAPNADAPSKRICTPIEGSTYFLNDPEMNEKWDAFMLHVQAACNGEPRCWGSDATNYFIYELGRYIVADDSTLSSNYGSDAVTARTNRNVVISVKYKNTVFTVTSLTSNNDLPTVKSSGYKFFGWTDGEKTYTKFDDASLDGKTLYPDFKKEFTIKWASSRQAAKADGLSITNATYTNGDKFPSAVYRDKVLLKYNEKGQLEVVAVGLNGVRLTTNPADSFYVEGQSNLEYDLVIIGYSADADTLIQGLALEAGDIIEIDAEKDVYDVTDGADPDNWSPDHEVNVKAYITYVE